MKTTIYNATIVNEGRQFIGSVIIEDELITDIIEGAVTDLDDTSDDQMQIDATGLYLFPGVIDTHVHFREPGLTHKADIESESRTAAAGGVTSYMEMPNTLPPTTTLERLEEKFQLAQEKSRVNYSFFFGASKENVELLKELDSSRVPGVKVFMGSSTGNMVIDDDDVMWNIFANSPLRIVAHCEEDDIIRQNIEQFKRKYKGQNDFPVRYHSRIRSVEACYEASNRAVRLARKTGARLHIAHISSARELDLLLPPNEGSSLNKKTVTGEACIAHLMFSTEDYDQLGTKIKCNPSVKTPEDKQALRDALCSGLIDIVATDHAPHLLSEKEGGALKAMSGMPLIQYSLVSMLEMCDEGCFPIERIPQLMSHNPADLYCIDRRGFIRKGYYADLVLVDPNANWAVSEERNFTKCGWTPMEDHTFKWKVVRTFVNGNTVYLNGSISDSVRGKELVYKP